MTNLKTLHCDKEMSEFKFGDLVNSLESTITLSDYDWMTYSLEAHIPTKDQGDLNVSCKFIGHSECEVLIEQNLNEKIVDHNFTIDYIIYIDFLKKYLTGLSASLGTSKAFDNSEILVDFYNRVISEFKSYVAEAK